MRIAVIGAGNAGTALGLQLKYKGHRISAVWSRDIRKARTLARKLSSKAFADISELPRDLDLYLIAIKDDEVRNLAARLNPGSGVVAHVSGSLEMDVFRKKFKKYGVLWPVMTFSAANRGKKLRFPVVINANSTEALRVLKQAGKSMSPGVYIMTERQRAASHLAAVFANNFGNHLVHLAQRTLKKGSCPPTLLNELILETARLAVRGRALHLQTGPAVRQDLKTMLKHRKQLKNSKLTKNIYKLMSQSIVKNMV
ncbi:MAG: DUF2520 domain-containing protein [Bacteroidia bacterium]|nr:DUF2520 domain-containing protein [Bacteroidia bacterium]